MIFFNRKAKTARPVQPILHTERLVLRSFDPNDAVDVYAFGQSETVARMAGFTPHRTLEDGRRMVKAFMESGDVWAIVEKKSGHVIGFASLHKDDTRYTANARKLGYTLGEAYWGQGFATETCRELIRYAFEERQCAVLAVSHFPFNHKSKRVIKKLGFSYEGTLRHAHDLPDGSVSELVCYSLTKPEYEALKAGK